MKKKRPEDKLSKEEKCDSKGKGPNKCVQKCPHPNRIKCKNRKEEDIVEKNNNQKEVKGNPIKKAIFQSSLLLNLRLQEEGGRQHGLL